MCEGERQGLQASDRSGALGERHRAVEPHICYLGLVKRHLHQIQQRRPLREDNSLAPIFVRARSMEEIPTLKLLQVAHKRADFCRGSPASAHIFKET